MVNMTAASTNRTVRRSPVDARRRDIADLLGGAQPLTARAILAAALLGAEEPTLPVASLIAVASLFGIKSGAARTCLWRMVTDGELTSDRATYSLAGRLLDRRQRVDTAARTDHTPGPWDGTWEVNIITLDRRDAMDRLGLRAAATRLHLAEIREGVWARPDNLPADRDPAARATVDQQCIRFRGATSEVTADFIAEAFALTNWSTTARRLLVAIDREQTKAPYEDDDIGAVLSHQFTLSMAIVAHLEQDPQLPSALLAPEWPAEQLRIAYREFDRTFQRTMNHAMRYTARP
jgi:phenylacetic acid degradation operon negative regulatory protein